MYIKEIKEKISDILRQPIGMETYFVLKKEDKKIVKRVNISDEILNTEETNEVDMLAGFCMVLEETINEYDENNEILKLSSADERNYGLYYYDLDEFPFEMKLLKDTLKTRDVIELFEFKADSLEEITAIIVLIGSESEKILLYKQQYPISLLKRDKLMLTPVPHKNRLKQYNEDLLRIDFNFQFFLLDDVIYISDINKMEKICSFTRIIQNEANKSIKMIDEIGILENVEVLEDELDNLSFARKLTKIYKESRVLGKVSNEKIIEFVKKHKYFNKNPLKINGDKISLNTKKSKETFLKLINDDLLISELTNNEYESLAKNNM